MKRFEAIYTDNNKNNHLTKDDEVFAVEVRFVIIAKSKERALELIEQEGENPEDFELEQVSGGVKDQLGRYFPESIRDARN
jgi:hypothetical protein